jgi:hypothetical protein
MTKRRGDPCVTVRLEPEVLELLKEKAGSAKGKFGGAAHHVRRLIYEDLGLGEPPADGAHRSERSGRRKLPEDV